MWLVIRLYLTLCAGGDAHEGTLLPSVAMATCLKRHVSETSRFNEGATLICWHAGVQRDGQRRFS